MRYENGMKIVSITEDPVRIYGLAVKNSENRQFCRLPQYMLERMPQYAFLGRRCIGGRVRFATDSARIFIRMTLDACREDINIPLLGSAGADVYLGAGKSARYLGAVLPKVHSQEEVTVERELVKPAGYETVTINLPRNDLLLAMEIGVDENAVLEAAPSYRMEDPIVFYGSSITEGGCAERVGTNYVSIVSRWLDADFFNYGFSGAARGEPEFAEYVAAMERISVFVYDYDHNAPSVEHLEKTHEPFFRIIRNAKPQLPVVMISRPDTRLDSEDTRRRRDVIRRTWETAKNAGDDNVWFLDGAAFFGPEGREECTVDGVHPTGLGFMRMAENIYPLLEQILYGRERIR